MDLPFLSLSDQLQKESGGSFNPYSNGSSFFMIDDEKSILDYLDSFNPYSNGSSFFITQNHQQTIYPRCFNPYSNGSSFFIPYFWTLQFLEN